MTGGPDRADTAAFFDVDGTLIDATIVHYYVYFRRRCMPSLLGTLWYFGFLLRCLYFFVLDRIDRGRFNAVFYRGYRGLSVKQIRSFVGDCHQDVILPRRFPKGQEYVAHHRNSGERIILVSGSVDFLLAPLADEIGASILATSLVERNGRFTGEMKGPPVGEHEKARLMETFAQDEGIDLSRSHAYGDSINDLPMLEIVGYPHAVNPDKALMSIARSRGWPIHHWTRNASLGKLRS